MPHTVTFMLLVSEQGGLSWLCQCLRWARSYLALTTRGAGSASEPKLGSFERSVDFFRPSLRSGN